MRVHREQRVKPENVAGGPKPMPAHGPAGAVPAASHADLMALQRLVGNQAVARMVKDMRHAHGAGCGHGEPVQRSSVQDALRSPGRPLDERDLNGKLGRDGSASVHVQRKMPGKNAPGEHYVQNPAGHPEWPLFHRLMLEGGFSENVVQNLWQLLVGGLLEQEKINLKSPDPSLTRTQKRVLRAGNDWYQQAIQMLRENKGFATSKMALWSGGLDVCKYAESKGYTPMEFTRAGKVFNQLEYHKDWVLQGPLWNALSKFYVEQANGPVHIFLRSYNPDSVLIGQEVPELHMLQRINPDVQLLWHPLYTTEKGEIKEVSPQRKLVADATYTSRDKCVAVLYDFLMYHHDESNTQASISYKEMREELSKNINAKK